MKKIVLFIVLIMIFSGLFGCSKKEYKINYNGDKALYHDARDSYKAGSKVKLIFDGAKPGIDYYEFRIDGELVPYKFVNGKMVITFKMPSHDISLMCYTEHEMTVSGYQIVHYHEFEPEDGAVSMDVTDYDCGEKTLTAVIYNKTDDVVCYGADYSLQKKTDGEYIDLEPDEEISWIMIAYELPAGETAEVNYDLSGYGILEDGEYRLIKSNGLTADFRLFTEYTE